MPSKMTLCTTSKTYGYGDADAVHDQHLALHQVVSIWLLGKMLCGIHMPSKTSTNALWHTHA